MAGRFELEPRGPISLAASGRFLEGFAPAARDASPTASAAAGHLHLAFVPDGWATDEPAGVCLRQPAEVVKGKVYGQVDPVAVRHQVERVFSLDVDGTSFPEVGRRDEVVGRLQKRYPGLRPVSFFSPYEAAAWALISGRIRIVQAAQIKARMAEGLGPVVEIEGAKWQAFPGPRRLGELEAFRGLFGRKVEYLRGLAAATLQGRLDAQRLRALSTHEALAELKTIDGIGDFGAQLILLRGAGAPDALPTAEPRLARAVAIAYGLPEPPSAERLEAISEAWRPYRTWVAVLLRTMLEDETGEIAGTRKKAHSMKPRRAIAGAG
ncbi:MAG: DNA-3-methyladenine glycosylase 2 family protein [Chloroflexi bacterium]|nr:DNA-3-methyladenine glycosylase 2 family protein [Chloroflexota bacterium]